MEYDPNIIKITVLIILSLPFIVFVFASSKRIYFAKKWTMAAVLFLLIVVHYSLFGTSKTDENNEILICGAAILNLTFWLGNSIKRYSAIFNAERILSIFAASFVIWNVLPGTLLSGENYIEGNYIGVTANANILGGYLAICCVPLLVAGALRTQARLGRLSYWLLVAAACLLIFLTRSRAATLALGMSIAFLSLYDPRIGRSIKIFIVGVVALLTALFVIQSSTKYLDIGLFGTRDLLIEQRLAAIEVRPWLGWGFNSDVFGFYHEKAIFPPMEKGNTILQALEEFGILFGGVVMVATYAFFWIVSTQLRKGIGNIGFSGTLIAGITHLTFETWLFNFQSILSIYAWILLLSLSFALPKNLSIKQGRREFASSSNVALVAALPQHGRPRVFQATGHH